MPPHTVSVAAPSVFGNVPVCTPHGCWRKPCGCCDPFRCCVDVYEEYVRSGLEGRGSRTGAFRYMLEADQGYPIRNEIVRRLPELRDMNLACWCELCPEHAEGKPMGVHCRKCKPCHVDVLLELVNREGE